MLLIIEIALSNIVTVLPVYTGLLGPLPITSAASLV